MFPLNFYRVASLPLTDPSYLNYIRLKHCWQPSILKILPKCTSRNIALYLLRKWLFTAVFQEKNFYH